VTPLARTVTRTRYPARGAIRLEKGDELGRFLLGSTAILLFPEGKAEFLQGLTCDSPVQMGQKIGKIS
jgi:phosphatidylserine decarboxylase